MLLIIILNHGVGHLPPRHKINSQDIQSQLDALNIRLLLINKLTSS